MPDDPFNLSQWPPTLPPRFKRTIEDVGSFRSAAGDEWRLRLLFHGEFGVEVSLTSEAGAVMAHRFDTHALAVQWAAQERELLEKGEE